MVSSDGTTVEGIVSERDVVRHLHSDGTVINNTVRAIMTTPVETCERGHPPRRPDEDHDRAPRCGTCPWSRAADWSAMISIGDVVKHQIDQLEFERDQLDSYLHQT